MESGNSSVVELHLAKVDVASSNLVSRSIFLSGSPLYNTDDRVTRIDGYMNKLFLRRHGQVAKAEDCKSLIPGSNPGAAFSLFFQSTRNAGVAELVDAADLKSAEAYVFVPVRVRPPAIHSFQDRHSGNIPLSR